MLPLFYSRQRYQSEFFKIYVKKTKENMKIMTKAMKYRKVVYFIAKYPALIYNHFAGVPARYLKRESDRI